MLKYSAEELEDMKTEYRLDGIKEKAEEAKKASCIHDNIEWDLENVEMSLVEGIEKLMVLIKCQDCDSEGWAWFKLEEVNWNG